MIPPEPKIISIPKGAVFLALILINSAVAQVAPNDGTQSGTTTPAPDSATVTDVKSTSSATPVQLSPFEVSADSNTGYGSSSTTSAARIAQNYIDVPQTVNVITSQFIDDYNLRDARELFNWIPNLIEPQDGNPNYQLRGLNVGYLYIDGVATANVNPLPIQFFDRVEVVKGPSSAAFGAGTPGGLINFASKTPSGADKSELSIGIGDHNSLDANLDSQGHLANHSNITYRVDAYWEKGNYWVRNESHKGEGALFALRDAVTPTLNLQLITAYSQNQEPNSVYGNWDTWQSPYIYSGFTDIVSVGLLGHIFQELPGTTQTPPGPTAHPGLPGGSTSDSWANGGQLISYYDEPAPTGWNTQKVNAFRETFIVDKSFFDNQVQIRNTAVVENQQSSDRSVGPAITLLTNNDPTSPDYYKNFDQPVGVYGMEVGLGAGTGDHTTRSENLDVEGTFDLGKWGKYTATFGGDLNATGGGSSGYSPPSINPDGTILLINMYDIPNKPAYIPSHPVTGPKGQVYQPENGISGSSYSNFQNGVYAQLEGSFLNGMLTAMAGWRRDWSLVNDYDYVNNVSTPGRWLDTKGAPRFALTVKPLKWLSFYGLVTQHKDPTQTTFKYILATRGDIQPDFIAKYNNFTTLESYQPTGTLGEGGVKVSYANRFMTLTGSFCVYHETASGQTNEEGIPPTIDPDGSETQVVQVLIGGADSNGYEAELFGTIGSRFDFIADWDRCRGHINDYANPYFSFGSNNGQPATVPDPIDMPDTVLFHGKYDFGNLHGKGFYVTFGAKYYGPYLINWTYPSYTFIPNWQHTFDGGVGYRWNHGKDSLYLNVDNFTNEKVITGIVQYYILSPFEQAYLTYTRKF